MYFLKRLNDGSTVNIDGDKSIGRTDTNDLVLTNGHPSRNHAKLSWDGSELKLMDMGSANGSFVNGNRLDPEVSTSLSAGDKIAFDIDEYLVEQLQVDEDDKTVMRPAHDADKTVMRPASELEAALVEAEKAAKEKKLNVEPKVVETEAPSAPPPEPKPAAQEAQAAVRPGAWADPDAATAMEGRTVLLDKDKLQEMMGNASASLDNLPEEVDVPSLIITSGSLTGTLFPLEDSSAQESAWLIGSESGCNIVLGDSNVSGRHAKLSSQNGRWQLTDQMTVNGTFVNGKKSTLSYLSDGDRLTFGSVTALFKIPGGKKKKAAKAATSPSGGTTAAGGSQKLILISFVVTLGVAAIAYFTLMK